MQDSPHLIDIRQDGKSSKAQKIDASEIMIHTGGAAMFLNKQVDPNSKVMGVAERSFVQQFLEFYNNEILEGKDFEYEEFFDFYKDWSVERSSQTNSKSLQILFVRN
ncbi:MAG: hypothetical protein WDN75_19520 [Bacteroidota bacterium]